MKRLGKFLQLTRSERRCSARCCSGNQARAVAVAISDLAPSFSADHGEETVAGGTSLCRQSRLGSGGGQPLHARRQMSRSGSGYTGCFASTVTKLTSASVLLAARKGSAHAWVEIRAADCQRWIKRSVALYPLLEKYNERDRWHLPHNRTVDSADLQI